ncbi:MAG TPA: DNA mismatch repair protein MutL, partial [Ruminococcaceae bacterium]|nr:DNA mismatch repair protein MutL [Oscillospiraceae bacterium]
AGYLASSRTDVTTEHLDWLYHNIACRAAIKARDESSPQELIALARRLEENPQIRYCPHGRPIFIVLTRHELEKDFGRA